MRPYSFNGEPSLPNRRRLETALATVVAGRAPAPACEAPENSVDEARGNAARPTHADEKLQLKSGTH